MFGSGFTTLAVILLSHLSLDRSENILSSEKVRKINRVLKCPNMFRVLGILKSIHSSGSAVQPLPEDILSFQRSENILGLGRSEK